MQIYDLVMLVVLASATLFGFWKGLAWQVASLASLVVSYFVALRFADRIAPMVSAHEPWNKFVAMLIIYAAASLVIWMIFRVVSGVIDRVKLNEFDRQMGALVGFGKGVLLCVAITFFAVTLLGQTQRERIIASRSGQYIVRILDKADSVAPPEIHQVIGPYIQQINQRLDPNYQPNPAGDLQDIQRMWQQQASPAAGGAATTPTPGGGWTTSAAGGVPWPAAGQEAPRAGMQTPAWPAPSNSQRR
jgi:membrane protein required for colicin V production